MEHLLIDYGYAALFFVTAISAFGIPIGSEIAMGFAGALAGGAFFTHGHHFSLGAVILVALAGEIVGSTGGYLLGRFGGRPLIDRIGRYLLLTHKDLDQVESLFKKRGDSVVLVGRLIPLLRSFVSIAAGLAEMSIVSFYVFTVLGCAIWCAALCSLGDALGADWHQVIKDFSYAGYVCAALAVLVVLAGILHRLRVLRTERLTPELTTDSN